MTQGSHFEARMGGFPASLSPQAADRYVMDPQRWPTARRRSSRRNFTSRVRIGM